MEIAANTNTTKRLYTCKFNRGWNRIKTEISLKDEALDAIIKMIRDISDENYFSKNFQKQLANFVKYIPTDANFDLNRRCVMKYHSMKTILRVFTIFPPPKGFNSIDLIGAYKGTDCCTSTNSMLWFWGFNSDRCLTMDQVEQFRDLVSKSAFENVVSLALWPKEEILYESNKIIKKILKLTPLLRSLTLRGAVDDSVLLMIAKLCPQITRLDFARSLKLSDDGLNNLALTHPNRRLKHMKSMIEELKSYSFTTRIETLSNNSQIKQTRSMSEDWNTFKLKHMKEELKTNCARNLQSVKLSLNSKVTNAGLQVFGLIMDIGYRVPLPPDVVVFRPQNPRVIFGLKYQLGSKLKFLKEAFERNGCEFTLSEDEIENLENVLRIVLVSSDQALHGTYEIDAYKLPNKNFEIFARKIGCLYIRGLFELQLPFPTITKLVMPWEDFNWSFRTIVTINDLALYCPNVKNVKGRFKGNLDTSAFRFQSLQFVEIWTLDDTTVVSFLTKTDNLKILDVKNVRTELVQDRKLTDEYLMDLIEQKMIPASLEEFVVRPTDISLGCLRRFIAACPNLKRVGDLECWPLTDDEIGELNKELKSVNSQCSLIVTTFPPRLSQIPGFEY